MSVMKKQLDDASWLSEVAARAVELLHLMLSDPALSDRLGPDCLANLQAAAPLLGRVQGDFLAAVRDELEGMFDD